MQAFTFPASFTQAQLWLLDRIDPGSPVYNLPQALDLEGPLDVAALGRALDAIVQRHESLRTTFAADSGRPLQVIAERAEPQALPVIDLCARGGGDRWPEAQRLIAAEAKLAFDLAAGPLVRAKLLRLEPTRHVLLVTMHHIIADGWSLAVFVRELAVLYEAFVRHQPSPLPDLPIQYVDYAEWQRGRLEGPLLQAQLEYWRKTLAGAPPLLNLPTDRPRPAVPTFEGATVHRMLEPALTDRLRRVVAQENATVSMGLHTAFRMLLARETGQEDFVLGSVSAGRSRAETEPVIGYFANTIALRTHTSGNPTGREMLARVRETLLEALAHQDVPFHRIVAELNPPRSLSHHPIFQVLVATGELRDDVLHAGPVTIRPLPVDGSTAKFDLTLEVVDGRDAVRLALEFSTDLFERASAERLMRRLEATLAAFVEAPDRPLASMVPDTECRAPIHGVAAPSDAPAGVGAPRVEPASGAVEHIVRDIWAEVLGLPVEGIPADADFFDLGGHSLLAARVMARVRERLGVDVPLRALFERPTVADLAGAIESARQRTGSSRTATALRRVPRGRPLPLSIAQEQIWFLNQLHPELGLYNVPEVLRLDGPLDVEALGRSVCALVERHEALRTAFVEARAGEPRLVVLPDARPDVLVVDVPDETAAARAIEEETRRPFAVEKAPLLRAAIFRLYEQRHVLALTAHHLVTDAWSQSILLRELGLLYASIVSGLRLALPPLDFQHADYASWQRRSLEDEDGRRALAYWTRVLAGARTLELEADRPRPAVRSARGSRHRMRIPPDVTRELRKLAIREGVTPFMVLLAVFQTQLARYTGQTDISVGTDAANRERVEFERVVGLFVDNVVLRTDLSGDPTFRELLARVRETALGAFAHLVPFGSVLAAVRPARTLGQTPLFQALLVLQNAPASALTLPGLTVSPVPVDNGTSKFDLSLFMVPDGDGLDGTWVHRSDLFDEVTIARAASHFEALLGSAIRRPETRLSQLNMLTDRERSQRAMEESERRQATLNKLRGARRKAVNLAETGSIRTSPPPAGSSLPLTIEPTSDDVQLADWADEQRPFIERLLLEHGALLFRGFGLRSIAEFEAFVQRICPELFEEYGDLPREGVGGRIYKSTPYPADRPILFHNESSHLHQWPRKIWFHCVRPAAEGGETPIVDCREIYRRLDPQVRDRFADKQLMYVRNYTDGLDVRWQDFFHTEDRAVVEAYCARASMTCEWKADGGLRTREICPAVIRHPLTGEPSFFNQIQLHHVSCLEPAVRESLESMFAEDDLPRNVYYGDGTPIEDSLVRDITNLYWESSVAPRWQAGDVMMLDNMLTAHARNPFVGERKIVVAMGELVHKSDVVGEKAIG